MEEDEKPIYERVNPAKIDSEQPIGLVDRNINSTKFGLYYKNNLLTDRQFAAASELERHWHNADMEPNVTSSYSDIILSGGEPNYGMPSSERIAHHRKEYRKAIKAVGPSISPILEHVICQNRPASEHAALYGARGRTAETIGMANFRMALNVLADYFKLAEGIK